MRDKLTRRKGYAVRAARARLRICPSLRYAPPRVHLYLLREEHDDERLPLVDNNLTLSRRPPACRATTPGIYLRRDDSDVHQRRQDCAYGSDRQGGFGIKTRLVFPFFQLDGIQSSYDSRQSTAYHKKRPDDSSSKTPCEKRSTHPLTTPPTPCSMPLGRTVVVGS